jgi:hypothetical protein
MAQGTQRDAETHDTVDTIFAVLMSVAALLALMGIIGLASRVLAVTPDPVWMGVTALLIVAVIVAALYAGPNRADARQIPGRKVFLFLLLGIVAGFFWWMLGRGFPALAPFALSPLLIGLLVYFLLLGHERRQDVEPQAEAPDEPLAMTAPAAKPKRRTSRTASGPAPKRRAPKRTAKRRATTRRTTKRATKKRR